VLEFSFKGFVEDGGEQGVEFGGGLGLGSAIRERTEENKTYHPFSKA